MNGKAFPYYAQHDANDCGPSCLRMVAKFYGKDYSLQQLRDYCFINSNGVSLLGISEAAEKIGFHSLMVKTDYQKIINDVPLPAILHWNQEHFVVLYDKSNIRSEPAAKRRNKFVIGDPHPSSGIISVDEPTFRKSWISDADDKGVALVLYPTEKFFNDDRALEPAQKNSLKSLIGFLKPYKKYIAQLLLGMLIASIFSLAVPLLTQAMLDYGIQQSDNQLVMLILIGQLMIFAGETCIEIIRNIIFLSISSRVTITIISGYLTKLMRLPIRFFDIRSTGDIIQRLKDYDKIENFLTGTTINTIFSFLNIIIFSIVILLYSPFVFLLFFLMSALSVGWIFFFQRRRKILNYKRFQNMRASQDSLYEIINGIKEIKLNNAEISRRWQWERNQVRLFKINAKALVLEQWQRIGFGFINHLKNILITYVAAREVMSGSMTIGMMLSVVYIIGQTNWPLNQLIDFFRSAQDARISFDRLNEVETIKKEDEGTETPQHQTEAHGDIVLNNLYFQYGSPRSPYVLEDITTSFPKGKVTAIVGPSGCGKTTLLKLLLKFYPPVKGDISIGDTPLPNISDRVWRNQCAAVLQDGHFFADTIAHNIVIDGSEIDENKMNRAVHMANIKNFINRLPLGYTTKLGINGSGLSAGQKQRLLIARAVYKDPDFLLLDEATSALDAGNEKVIIGNLAEFYKGKTVIIVAHRLSTVKNADQIVVMNEGQIVETGTHHTLVKKRGFYYELVSNQLELGN